jgi:hypothetical protein
MTETIDQYGSTALTVLGVLAILVPVYVKWVRPKWRAFRRDVIAGRDALVGRDAILDPVSGTRIADALPGIGKRMENFETALVTLAANQSVLVNHEDRIMALEMAATERIITRAESGAAFSAMEAAYRSTPETNDNRDHREQREDAQRQRELDGSDRPDLD